MEERLQKLISAAGICSRRHAEALLAEGKVTVNGAPAHVGDRADPDRDEIRVDGVLLTRQEKMVYLMLNKPRGVVTTLQDEKGRTTVADLVRDCGVRVYPVGRLDMDSEGLILLTNDGALMQRLLHPSFGVDKTYRVVVAGAVGQAARRLAEVRALEDGTAIRPAQVETLRRGGETAELEITIHEGKNRQIRRMCALCGLHVKRLQRVREHSLCLGELPPGKWRYLTEKEIADLQQA